MSTANFNDPKPKVEVLPDGRIKYPNKPISLRKINSKIGIEKPTTPKVSDTRRKFIANKMANYRANMDRFGGVTRSAGGAIRGSVKLPPSAITPKPVATPSLEVASPTLTFDQMKANQVRPEFKPTPQPPPLTPADLTGMDAGAESKKVPIMQAIKNRFSRGQSLDPNPLPKGPDVGGKTKVGVQFFPDEIKAMKESPFRPKIPAGGLFRTVSPVADVLGLMDLGRQAQEEAGVFQSRVPKEMIASDNMVPDMPLDRIDMGGTAPMQPEMVPNPEHKGGMHYFLHGTPKVDRFGRPAFDGI